MTRTPRSLGKTSTRTLSKGPAARLRPLLFLVPLVLAATARAEDQRMTRAEMDGFRQQVQGCWRVTPGSEAATLSVTVHATLDRDGRITGDVTRMAGSEGSAEAETEAFQSARRALLRCQGDGYALPPEKYDLWKEVELTFDPSGMGTR